MSSQHSTGQPASRTASTGSTASHKGKHDEVFDPHKSATSEETMDKFLKSPLSGKLEDIPGIGDAHKAVLMKASVAMTNCKECHINTSFQLIGVYLACKEPGMSMQQHHNKFYNWLFAIGVHGQRNTIVDAVARRAALMDIHLYQKDEYVKS